MKKRVFVFRCVASLLIFSGGILFFLNSFSGYFLPRSGTLASFFWSLVLLFISVFLLLETLDIWKNDKKKGVMIIYHITPKENVESILRDGFIPKKGTSGRISFCKKESLPRWLEIMKDFHSKKQRNSVLEVTVEDTFYEQEFFDWNEDEYSGGPKGEVSYGEGKNGWNDPIPRPLLKSGINCTIIERSDLSVKNNHDD